MSEDRIPSTPRGLRRQPYSSRNRLVQETASSAAKRRPPSGRNDLSGTVTPGSICSTPASAAQTPRTGSRKGSRSGENVLLSPLLMPELGRFAVVNQPEPVEDPESDLDKFLTDGDNIQVVVRLRGGESQSRGYSTAVARSGLTSLTVFTEPDPQAYAFDFVAGENTTQASLYQVIGPHLIGNFLRGYNSTLLAYGQTNSGKTYSMLGTAGEGHGIIPRTLASVIPAIQRMREEAQLPTHCFLTAVEIYNESIVDLVCPSTSQMAIREDSNRGMFVDGAQEVEIETVEEAMQQLALAVSNRRRGQSSLNPDASRSHMVITLLLERQFEDRHGVLQYSYSRLNLVDLAGSERQRIGAVRNDRVRETSAINKSLSTLTKCVMSLTESMHGKSHHVPYRDSKLTYLLQSSLGGNGKTVLLATVSSRHDNVSETLSTLRFAHRAKSIVNPATVNCAPLSAIQLEPQALMQEVERIKTEYMNLMQHERELANKGAAAKWQQQQRQVQAELDEQRTALQMKDDELQQLRSRLESIEATARNPSGRNSKEGEEVITEGTDPQSDPQHCASPRIAATRSLTAPEFAELGVLDLRASMDATTRLEKLGDYRARLDTIMTQIQQRVDGRSARRPSTVARMPSLIEEEPLATGARSAAGTREGTPKGTPKAGALPTVPAWNFEEDISLLRAEVEAQYMAATEQKSSLKTMQVELDALRREVQMKDEELIEARNQVLEMQEMLEQQESLLLQNQMQLADKERELSNLQRFKQETEQWHAGVRDYVVHLEQGMSAAQNRASHLETQVQREMDERRNAQAAAEAAQALNESLQAEMERLNQMLEEYRAKFAEIEAEQLVQDIKHKVNLDGGAVTYDIVASTSTP